MRTVSQCPRPYLENLTILERMIRAYCSMNESTQPVSVENHNLLPPQAPSSGIRTVIEPSPVRIVQTSPPPVPDEWYSPEGVLLAPMAPLPVVYCPYPVPGRQVTYHQSVSHEDEQGISSLGGKTKAKRGKGKTKTTRQKKRAPNDLQSPSPSGAPELASTFPIAEVPESTSEGEGEGIKEMNEEAKPREELRGRDPKPPSNSSILDSSKQSWSDMVEEEVARSGEAAKGSLPSLIPGPLSTTPAADSQMTQSTALSARHLRPSTTSTVSESADKMNPHDATTKISDNAKGHGPNSAKNGQETLERTYATVSRVAIEPVQRPSQKEGNLVFRKKPDIEPATALREPGMPAAKLLDEGQNTQDGIPTTSSSTHSRAVPRGAPPAPGGPPTTARVVPATARTTAPTWARSALPPQPYVKSYVIGHDNQIKETAVKPDANASHSTNPGAKGHPSATAAGRAGAPPHAPGATASFPSKGGGRRDATRDNKRQAQAANPNAGSKAIGSMAPGPRAKPTYAAPRIPAPVSGYSLVYGSASGGEDQRTRKEEPPAAGSRAIAVPQKKPSERLNRTSPPVPQPQSQLQPQVDDGWTTVARRARRPPR
ncbi:hypothetical protein GGS23DRAFT_548683, partial [Durotheca rogersii]|uniref:uncharacterized protein n=1 Tax=Durotheca rogersii TaxID=419775 RepID=UPI00221F7950